jgi:hypothetical protein
MVRPVGHARLRMDGLSDGDWRGGQIASDGFHFAGATAKSGALETGGKTANYRSEPWALPMFRAERFCQCRGSMSARVTDGRRLTLLLMATDGFTPNFTPPRSRIEVCSAVMQNRCLSSGGTTNARLHWRAPSVFCNHAAAGRFQKNCDDYVCLEFGGWFVTFRR